MQWLEQSPCLTSMPRSMANDPGPNTTMVAAASDQSVGLVDLLGEQLDSVFSISRLNHHIGYSLFLAVSNSLVGIDLIAADSSSDGIC